MTSDPQSSTQHAQQPRKHQSKSASHSNHSQADGFYGHEDTAKMSAAFITHLFNCPEVAPASVNTTPSGGPAPSPKLCHFVAYALHRTRLASSVTYAALHLLQRLKTRFPAARGSSGHRLFISAFMIASKIVCDDTYSNKSWTVVGQSMFSLREINQMEREMCGYLEWHLNIAGDDLEKFSDLVTKDFGSPALYSSYLASKPAPIAAAAASIPAPAAPLPSVVTKSPTLGLAPVPTSESPLTVISTHVEDDDEFESPVTRSSAGSSPESDMVSTPTSVHGPEDSYGANPHVVSHEAHVLGRSHLAGHSALAAASKLAAPPVVKLDASGREMSARAAVW